MRRSSLLGKDRKASSSSIVIVEEDDKAAAAPRTSGLGATESPWRRRRSIIKRAAHSSSSSSSQSLEEQHRTSPRDLDHRPSLHVDRLFVATALVLVPEKASEVPLEDLQAFRARLRPNEWYELDVAEFILGGVFHVFEETASVTESMVQFRWVFWTDNDLNRRLVSLLASIATDCHGDDYFFEITDEAIRLVTVNF